MGRTSRAKFTDRGAARFADFGGSPSPRTDPAIPEIRKIRPIRRQDAMPSPLSRLHSALAHRIGPNGQAGRQFEARSQYPGSERHESSSVPRRATFQFARLGSPGCNGVVAFRGTRPSRPDPRRVAASLPCTDSMRAGYRAVYLVYEAGEAFERVVFNNVRRARVCMRRQSGSNWMFTRAPILTTPSRTRLLMLRIFDPAPQGPNKPAHGNAMGRRRFPTTIVP